jgi:hypothetical protein
MWPIDRLVPYANYPRKNNSAVDQMCASIEEFDFKIPCLVRSDGKVVDGHLRLKAAKKLGIAEVPVILCDEWTSAQVKAFRIMVNRSVTWEDWDDELLALELKDIEESGFDLALTGFESKEIDDLMAALEAEETADEIVPTPATAASLLGDLWICGPHRLLCGDCTDPENVARLMNGAEPLLMVTDPPYGISLDSEWRDRAGLNCCGPAESSYMSPQEVWNQIQVEALTRISTEDLRALRDIIQRQAAGITIEDTPENNAVIERTNAIVAEAQAEYYAPVRNARVSL